MDRIVVAKRLRKLLQGKRITAHDYAVADTLLWRCHAPGAEEAQVSYQKLAELAGVARSTAQEALAKLRKLGVLTWRRTRIRIKWASRQWRNVYRFISSDTAVPATKEKPEREASGLGRLLAGLPRPHAAVRTVAEQLRLLR